MGTHTPANARGCNVGVEFDLAPFTERLFAILGAKASFIGPGPVDVQWLSSTTTESERFAINYLAEEMFSKFDDGVKSTAKRERAISRFEDAEALCGLTNCKFAPNAMGQCAEWLEPYSSDAPDLREVVLRARKHISRVLGAFPGWDALLQGMDFGPGATTRLARRKSDRSNKWAGRPHVTPLAASLLVGVFDAQPLLYMRFRGSEAEIRLGNKLDWVAKNYKTDRTIAVEPDWNMYLQKGIGWWIRRRLKRVKIDLDDQSVNRFLAALGSITGELATLDLSMASDTVAYRLVEVLIRPDWFSALKQCRSEVGFYSDENGVENAVIYEKFSSMGNGFTFELESLIFWGILRAVSDLIGSEDHRLYVYGDDIVVPTCYAGNAAYYLNQCGFMTNPSKSFTAGPFRESCGGHYFKGDDVTPFYVREPVNRLDRLFLLHNNVHRWFTLHPGICDPSDVRALLDYLRSFAPEEWRRPRLLSEDVGDGAFIGSFDEVLPEPIGRKKRYRGWEGWRAVTLQFRPKHNPRAAEALKKTKRFEEWTKYSYPQGSGPDLASLHRLDRRDDGPSPYEPKHYPKFLRERGAKAYANHVGSVSVENRELPDEDRFWFTGVQVLPWLMHSSWWNC